MKKCKKLTALLMAGVMGLSLFGCSSGKDAPTTAAPRRRRPRRRRRKRRRHLPQRLLKPRGRRRLRM